MNNILINKLEKGLEHLKQRNLKNIDLFVYFNYIIILIYIWISKLWEEIELAQNKQIYGLVFNINFFKGDVEDIS